MFPPPPNTSSHRRMQLTHPRALLRLRTPPNFTPAGLSASPGSCFPVGRALGGFAGAWGRGFATSTRSLRLLGPVPGQQQDGTRGAVRVTEPSAPPGLQTLQAPQTQSSSPCHPPLPRSPKPQQQRAQRGWGGVPGCTAAPSPDSPRCAPAPQAALPPAGPARARQGNGMSSGAFLFFHSLPRQQITKLPSVSARHLPRGLPRTGPARARGFERSRRMKE